MKKQFGAGMPFETEAEWDEGFEKQCKVVAKTIKISIAEARRRMVKLQESEIMQKGHPDDPDTRRGIDTFLSSPYWETEPEKVILHAKKEMAFSEAFSIAISEKKLIEQFDRLRGTTLLKFIDGELKTTEEEFTKQFNKFKKFFAEFIYARLPIESFK